LACGRAAVKRARDAEHRSHSSSVSGAAGGGCGGGGLAGGSGSGSSRPGRAADAADAAGAVGRVLAAAGLDAAQFAGPLARLGVRGVEDLGDRSLLSDAMLRHEVRMQPHQAAAFRRAVAAALPPPQQPPPPPPPPPAAAPAEAEGDAEDDFMAALEAQAAAARVATAAATATTPAPAAVAGGRAHLVGSGELRERPFVAKARGVLRANPKNLAARALVKDADGEDRKGKSSRKVNREKKRRRSGREKGGFRLAARSLVCVCASALLHHWFSVCLCAKAGGFVAALADAAPEDFARLYACLRSGLLRPESAVGCFATNANDYTEFGKDPPCKRARALVVCKRLTRSLLPFGVSFGDA
jgi:hypothetical protein